MKNQHRSAALGRPAMKLLSLLRKSVVRLTDRPDMTLDVYRGRKTTMQQQQSILFFLLLTLCVQFI